MQVVSVLNHKGGVGKTTLTANIGAGLAARGKRVLLLDLDSQASLTLSFFSADEWIDKLSDRTIKSWLEADDMPDMLPLLARPAGVNERLEHSTGYVDIIPAHRDLDHLDILLGSQVLNDPAAFAHVHGRLRYGLSMPALDEFDVALIDCAPAFGPVSRTAVAASDLILIPTRPDYLSTNGILSLGQKIMAFTREFNEWRGPLPEIHQPPASIVFTMVQSYAGHPIANQRQYMAQVVTPKLTAFDSYMSDSKAVYGPAPNRGVPIIIGGSARSQTRELRNIVSELIKRLDGLAS